MAERQQKTYQIKNQYNFINNVLSWATNHSHFTYFNPNEIAYPFEPFEHFIAIGCQQRIDFDGADDFTLLKQQCEKNKDWLIGYLGYDLKNQLEKLDSNNPDFNKFHSAYFYIPQHLIHFHGDSVVISSIDQLDDVFQQINKCDISSNKSLHRVDVKARVSKEEYVDIVKLIQQHIVNGDVYELNYCMEFYATQVEVDPFTLYKQLTEFSPTPFSVFQKIENQYLICASPERFIKKTKNKLISQPIKGTIKRGTTSEEDVILQYELKHSEKERAENMMIVDLVRNDLAKSCASGSVKVEEMFRIYPFKHLHQMISSVSGELRKDVHFVDAIKNAFPMGSMTGVPKVMTMKLIEKYESSRRGIFSGTVGYITPDGNFDFNVVIRSMFYHSTNKTLSFQVGSAITYDSDSEQEYEECILKAKAIMEVLNQ